MDNDNNIKIENEGSFIFHSPSETNASLILKKDGFYYMGERIDDIQDAYKRFNEWLDQTKITKQI